MFKSMVYRTEAPRRRDTDPSDVEDFETLYRDLYRVVLGYFRRRVQPERVEELTQETFLNAYRTRQRFRGEASDTTWLLVIAKNVFSNYLRRKKTRKRDGIEVSIDTSACEDDKPRELRSEVPDVLTKALADEQRRLVRKGLASLPRRSHQVMCLAFVHGLKYREIGSLLGIRENTVKSTIFHGKKKLKEFIQAEAPDLDVDLGESS